MAYLSVISIQTSFLKVLASVYVQRLALIQRTFPAIVPLLARRLHALTVYTECCGAAKLLPCRYDKHGLQILAAADVRCINQNHHHMQTPVELQLVLGCWCVAAAMQATAPQLKV